MEKKSSFKHFVAAGYFLGVVAWLFLNKSWRLDQWLEVVGLVIGAGLGWQIVWFDRLAYVFILHPEIQVSQYIKYYLNKKNYKSAWELLNKRAGEFDKLTTRSAVFQAAWVVLAIFALTSVGNWFGRALVMSLGLRVLIEEWQGYLTDKQRLKSWLFWQIKREISDKELKGYMYMMTGLFLWLTLVMV